MSAIAFLLSPLGRWLGGALLVGAAVLGIYMKGHSDGKAVVQAEWDAAVDRAAKRGEQARTDAERSVGDKPDADGMRNDPYNRDRP